MANASAPSDLPFQLRSTPRGLQVRVYVQPRARRSELAGSHDGVLKLKIAAPPVDDAANRAVVDFFATLLGIPKARVTISGGLKSRNKTMLLESVAPDDLLRLLPQI